MNNPETPTILSILVLEDLAMAVFLPVVAVLLIGQGLVAGVVSVSIALVTVGIVLFVALRHGETISRVVSHKSDEVVLLSTFGIVLVVAGIAQQLQVSAAVGAFLVGVALSGPIVKRAHHLLGPLRDLFAALFFLFFGLQIDPASLPPVLLQAVALGVVTGLTKLLTGWWAARRAGSGHAWRLESRGCIGGPWRILHRDRGPGDNRGTGGAVGTAGGGLRLVPGGNRANRRPVDEGQKQ